MGPIKPHCLLEEDEAAKETDKEQLGVEASNQEDWEPQSKPVPCLKLEVVSSIKW